MKRTLLAALAVLVAVAYAGCSDDPEPDFAPPESTSPAPIDPTTSATTPEELSPQETVRAWVEARNIAMATGDVTGLQDLSAADCASCKDQIQPIEAVYAAGGHFETDGWKVQSSKIDSQNGKRASVSTALVLAGGRTVPEAGADPVVYPEEMRIGIFELTMIEGQWAVSLIGFVR